MRDPQRESPYFRTPMDSELNSEDGPEQQQSQFGVSERLLTVVEDKRGTVFVRRGHSHMSI
jgi:hypothetical protein